MRSSDRLTREPRGILSNLLGRHIRSTLAVLLMLRIVWRLTEPGSYCPLPCSPGPKKRQCLQSTSPVRANFHSRPELTISVSPATTSASECHSPCWNHNADYSLPAEVVGTPDFRAFPPRHRPRRPRHGRWGVGAVRRLVPPFARRVAAIIHTHAMPSREQR